MQKTTEHVRKPRVDVIDSHVSKAIKNRRVLMGISQQELANVLGLSLQQIQKYEDGKNRVSGSRLYQVANYLKTQTDFFFEGLDVDAETARQHSLAEEPEAFVHDNAPDRELVGLINAFKNIGDVKIRKHILELVKSVSTAKI